MGIISTVKRFAKWAAKKIAQATALQAVKGICTGLHAAIEGIKGGRQSAINALIKGKSVISKIIGISPEIVLCCIRVLNELIDLLWHREISVKECITNIVGIIVESAHSIVFGIIGSIIGRILGAALGTAIFPGIGTVIGYYAGSFIGGYIGSAGIKLLLKIPKNYIAKCKLV